VFADVSILSEKAWYESTWKLARGQTSSGENVTEYTALNYSAVFNAVTLIAGTISTLPLRLIRKDNRRTITEDKRSIHRLLSSSPNPYMTAMALREAMMGHVLLWGNAYAEIVRNRVGEIIELWPITPNRVSIRMMDGNLVYLIKMSGQANVVLPRERVLHIPGFGFDGYVGYSAVGLAAKSIGLGMAMETFGEGYFGNGTHPGVIVSHPKSLGPDAAKSLQKSLVESYSGLGQAHRLLLLEEGMKLEKVGVPPNDSQFLESRQFQIPEIARWFNLPPHKLKDLTKSSFSNIEQEQISFVQDSILPWLVRLEQNYNMQLLNDVDKERGLYFKHTIEGLLRGSAAARSAFYKAMWNLGAMSQNDIREKEDMDPIEGGDEYFVPSNMEPLSKALNRPADEDLKQDSLFPDDEELKPNHHHLKLIPKKDPIISPKIIIGPNAKSESS